MNKIKTYVYKIHMYQQFLLRFACLWHMSYEADGMPDDDVSVDGKKLGTTRHVMKVSGHFIQV